MAQINYTATADLKSFSTWLTNNVDQNASTWDSNTQEGVLVLNSGVTEIGDDAFRACSSLLTIELPSGITKIGSFTFYQCTNITSVVLPNTLTNIGGGAFRECRSLTSIEIPNLVTKIKNGAFNGCTNLTSVTLSNSLTTIDDYAFSNCTSITSITLPNTLTTLGEAFTGCTHLTTFTIPDSVSWINGSCFNNTSWWNSQSNGIIYKDNWCLGYKGSKPTDELTIQNNIKGLATFAFNSCTGLTSVTFPDSLISLCDSAFNGCTGLTSITLPSSLTTIGYGLFSNCTSLTTIYWNAINITSLSNSWLNNCPINTVIFGNSVTTIPRSAFQGCTGLTSITLPNSLTSIGQNAFAGCTNLLSVTCLATTPPTLTTGNFTASGDTLYVPDVSLSAYQSADNWSTAFTYYVGITPLIINYKCTTDIMASPSTWLSQNVIAHTWDSTTQEGTLTLDYGVDYIGNNAFKGGVTPLYYNLLSLTIPEGIKSLGNDCINNCINITSVSLPQSLVTCGDYSICGCTNLTDISVPSSLTSVGTNFLRGCSHLQSVSFNNNLISYGEALCYQCSALTTVYWNTNATQSGGSYSPFTLCNNITTVVIGDDVIECPTIFKQKASITSLTLGNSLTSIPYSAFIQCRGLTSVTFPNSLTSIGDRAFHTCTGLTSLAFPNSLTSIGSAAFQNCSGLTSVTLGDSLTSIDNGAFQGCTNLLTVTCLATTPPNLSIENFTASNDTLYVPSTSKSTYENTTSWRNAFTTIAGIYNLTTSVSGSGSISPSEGPLYEGTDVTLTITPDEGNGIFSVTDNGTPVQVTLSGMTYTISNIAADHAIAVVFKPLFTITTSAGEGGTITPTTEVLEGESFTVTATPNAHYKVSHFVVDGVDVGTIDNYTFQNLDADHTIHVDFELITYTVSTTTTEGGTITPESSTVVEGSDVTLTITPDEGMLIFNVLDNDTPVPVLNPLGMTYTISNIQENHTVEAIFMVAQNYGFDLSEMIDTDFIIQTLDELEERK